MKNVQQLPKIKKNKSKWLLLSLYSNCFGEGDSTHLGLNFRGKYLCITHSLGNGVLIDKKHLKMRDISEKNEYLKRCISKPKKLHVTNMKIEERFVVKAILNSELNKMK